MARQYWAVFVDTERNLEEQETRGKYVITRDPDHRNFGLFYREDYAAAWAKKCSQENPGKEVYILKSDHGFYNAVAPAITQKKWVNGEYVPV